MAVDGQIPKLGFENGADDQFDFISEQNPAAAGAITIPQPAPGESVSITVPPGQALRVEFDVESTQVNGDGSQITLQLTDGSTVVLQSPEPGAFTADPPLLLTPEGAFDQALALYGYDGFGSQTPTTDADSDPNSVFQFGSDSDAQLTGNAITIEKPGPGDSLVYEIGPGQPLQLTFDLDDVEDILQTDDDIILAFADGAQITFSAMVDAAFSDAPPILLMPDGGLMSAEELLDLGSDINALADALQGIDSAAGNANIGPVTSYGSGSGENYSGLSLGQILNPTLTTSPPPPPPPPPAAVCNKGPYIVFFDWDKSDITPEAATILDSAVSAYGNCDNVPIMLAGYTDRSGTVQYNMGLSERRNDSVRAYLTSHGIPDGAISSQAFGESNPRVPTADGVRELQNRRVEITYGPGSGM